MELFQGVTLPVQKLYFMGGGTGPCSLGTGTMLKSASLVRIKSICNIACLDKKPIPRFGYILPHECHSSLHPREGAAASQQVCHSVFQVCL